MKRLMLLMIAATTITAVGCKKKGCMDPIAINFSEEAEKDDGSCEYDGSIAPEEITEDITTATTILAGTTKICGNIDVSADLTISPGATLLMCPNAAINVEETGSIFAEGTEDNPIVIRGETESKGYWSGIAIRSNNPMNQFDHVTIKDAGSYWAYEDANLMVSDGAQLGIINSTISNSELNGLFIAEGATLNAFSDNVFIGCVTGLTISPENVKQLDEASEYLSENDNSFIHVLVGDLSQDATWPALSAPLLVHGLDVSAGLTLEPGAHIQVESKEGIRVESTGFFNAVGTEDDPITIEGRVNTVAYWAGIQFRSNHPSNVFEHVTISDGGSYWAYSYANIQLNEGSLSIDNCTVTDANSWGLYVNSSSSLSSGGSVQTDPSTVEANNTFSNNGTGPDADCTGGCGVYFD